MKRNIFIKEVVLISLITLFLSNTISPVLGLNQSFEKRESEPIYEWCKSAFNWFTHSRSLCQGAGESNLNSCQQIYSSCGTVADLCSKGEFTGCRLTAKLCGLVADLCKSQTDCLTATQLCNIAITKCPIVTGEKKKLV